MCCPPAEALAEHAPLVGMHHLILDEQAHTAYLDAPGAWLDLGGIAKGYIADRALDVLREQGIDIAQVRARAATCRLAMRRRGLRAGP